MTRRLTTAQALVRFLAAQHVERDGEERPFFAGVLGIFGHGNVAGLGQALQQDPDLLPYVPTRNEQAQVHTAAAYARAKNRLQTFACTSSIGPGATNMLTGAAGATINRVPVLLLPGDLFASRRPAPVLQQLEDPRSQDASVNDAFRALSRYWDRIERPEQILAAAPEAVRVLTNQAETGAVTLSLPQDVQAEALEVPEAFLRKRVWHVPRPEPDEASLARAADAIRAADRPLLVAGGGVIYSEASGALARFAEATGIAVVETQAGKGSLPFDHPRNLGAAGVTGTPGAVDLAGDADVVIGVGTRWTDFTTASKTVFRHPDVTFVNLNVADFDAAKHAGLRLVGDARAGLEALAERMEGWSTTEGYRERVARHRAEWEEQVDRLFAAGHGPPPSQAEVIGAVNRAAGPRDVVVCAAGSLPGDLHRLWRTRDPKGYHVEYGYSCMGYEVAGGLGVKLADPDREVYVMVGDGSWLMMSSEIVTAVQEGVSLTVVLLDNHGFGSIGGLSRSLGSGGFGTEYRRRTESGRLDGAHLPLDFAANAQSLGVGAVRVETIAELEDALEDARAADGTTVVVLEVDPSAPVPGSGAWWDVPVAEESGMPSVREARESYEERRGDERWLL